MSSAYPAPTHSDPEPSQRELFHRLRNLDDMIRASEEAEDKYRRIAERRRIPPVPDLRFEYSFLRSVSQYVHLERAPASTSVKGKEKAVGGEDVAEELEEVAGEIVHVQWGPVLWIATRDQVISPLLQGALWGVAGFFLRPFGAMVGEHIRTWWARGASRGSDAPEGNGAHWLRNWAGSVLTPTPATHSLHR